MVKHTNEENENIFKRHVAKELSKYGHVSQVESPKTSPGFPDIEFCIDGIIINIETKHSDEKHDLHIRPSQKRWAHQRIKSGGRMWFLARFDMNSHITYILVHGNHAVLLDKSYVTWFKHKTAYWINSINYGELIEHLIR